MDERPGYKSITIQKGPQKGRKVLRIAWPEQQELRALGRIANRARDIDDEGGEAATVELYEFMAKLLPEWEFNDREGHPLPNPKDEPKAFDRIDPLTLAWLMPGGDSIWADVLPNARG